MPYLVDDLIDGPATAEELEQQATDEDSDPMFAGLMRMSSSANDTSFNDAGYDEEDDDEEEEREELEGEAEEKEEVKQGGSGAGLAKIDEEEEDGIQMVKKRHSSFSEPEAGLTDEDGSFRDSVIGGLGGFGVTSVASVRNKKHVLDEGCCDEWCTTCGDGVCADTVFSSSRQRRRRWQSVVDQVGQC